MLHTIFMGTPEFAVPVLRVLIEMQNVVAVYTRPDRPAGRGRRMASSPVKDEALGHGIAVVQPKSLKSAAAIEQVRLLEPELIIVAAYGLILPQAVLDIPPKGCINVHASLLPKYRGASPIASVLLNGEIETGITLMRMDAGLDTGPIIARRTVRIADDDTAGTLEQKLSVSGSELLRETLPRWVAGDITPEPQDNAQATVTRLIRKQDGRIVWSESADTIARMVRAFNPWPAAFTFWRGQPLKILSAHASSRLLPEGLVAQRDETLLVGTRGGSVQIDQLQLAGKRAMSASEFLRGHPDFAGSTLRESA